MDRLGRMGGYMLAPFTAMFSRWRRARMFHPDGLVYRARVEPFGSSPDLGSIGERLAGPALVRLSSAWWRGDKEWPDVLGMSIRFVGPRWKPTAQAHAGDQDLLLATIRFPWTTPFAPLATNVRSFLWNHFHAVSPFEVDGIGRVKLRARSPRTGNRQGLSRAEHLARAASEGGAVYELQVRRLGRPIARRSWETAARLVLERGIDVDQAALRFSPFRDGRGIHPVGFVHHLRIGAYAASQRARRRQSRHGGGGVTGASSF